MDINTILSAVILVGLGLGGYLLKATMAALEAGVKTSAEKGAEVAIKNVNWPRELAHELEKARGVGRQELRFKAYGALWAKQRPLAIYDAATLDRSVVAELSRQLSDWYFNEAGGLMLTTQVREFYFALQDLLRTTARADAWEAERVDDVADVFKRVLRREECAEAEKTLATLAALDPRQWSSVDASLGKAWHDDIKRLATKWNRLSPSEQFAVLQQVASTLRTSMVSDVESRMR